MQHDFDILVVGGGIAGLSQALALAGLGLRIALVDRQSAPPAPADLQPAMATPVFADRVSALTPASAQWLAALDVWADVAQLRVCPYRAMRVWDADGSGEIAFRAEDLHTDALGTIVENPVLCAVLAQAVRRHPAISCYFDTGLNGLQRHDTFWEIALDSGENLCCSLLIGADGGQSRVRELCGFRLREWAYGQQALVCSVRTAQPHAFTAWQRFASAGPLAFLPLTLPGGLEAHFSSIVWSCDDAVAAGLQQLAPAALGRALAAGLEARLGDVDVISEPRCFPLQQRHATDYIQPGVALVGDAAHTIHPLAGQGINLGLADAAALARVISQALARGEDYTGRQVLSRYQRARKGENLGMMLSMEGFKRVFGSDDLMLRFLRNHGLNLADRFGPVKQRLMKQAMGLNA